MAARKPNEEPESDVTAKDSRRRLYQEYTAGQRSPAAAGAAMAALFARVYIEPAIADLRAAPIVELGAGEGWTVAALRSMGFAACRGVDNSPSAVERAHAVSTMVELADGLEALQRCAPGSLGAVVALDVLEHLTLSEVMEWCDHVTRCLRADGRFVFRVPNGAGLFGGTIRHGDLTHQQAFTPSSVRQLLAASGLRALSILPCRPIVHGARSAVRALIWRGVELALLLADAAESGGFRERVYTRNLFVIARKA
jgi:SAM-dependent methyltransferase